MFRKLIGPKYKNECDDESFGCSSTDEETREIYLIGAVSDEMASAVIPAVRHLDKTRGLVTFIISSTGGDVDAGLAIYDSIHLMRNRTVCYAYGTCMSMSALILQACDKRYLSPNCRFMVHNGVMTVDGSYNEGMSLTKEIKLLNDIYLDIMAKRATIPLSKIKRMCNETRFMSAEEAYQVGFIDGILEVPKRRK